MRFATELNSAIPDVPNSLRAFSASNAEKSSSGIIKPAMPPFGMLASVRASSAILFSVQANFFYCTSFLLHNLVVFNNFLGNCYSYCSNSTCSGGSQTRGHVCKRYFNITIQFIQRPHFQTNIIS